MQKTEVEIYEMIPYDPPKGWKRHMGLTAWVGNTLYIIASATGASEMQAMFMCCADGYSICTADNHILVPETWARNEFPERSHLFDVIRKRAIEIRETHKETK